jgi:hypothetical protein
VSTRLGLALGLALAGAVAAWWLIASRIALQSGIDAALPAGEALLVLAVTRGMLVAVIAPRTAAVGGYVAGLRVCLPIVALGWPLVALSWAASSADTLRTLSTEAGLLGLAALLPLAGRALARLLKQGPVTEAVSAALGVLLACGAWLVLTGPLHGP